MSDPLDLVYDAMDVKDFQKAIEIAQEEAKKGGDDEFLFRKLIGKSLLDEYFIKLETQKDIQLSKQAQEDLLKSWTIQKEENEETLLFLADSELVLGMYEEAKAHYQQLSGLLQNGNKEQATLSACYAGQAECDMKMNKFEDAIKQYQNVIDRKDKNENQDFGQIYKNRAICFYNIGDYKSAEADIKQALMVNPKMAKLYALQANIFEAQNKYEEAEKFLDKVHKDCLTDPAILDAKGKIYLHQLKYAKAEEVFKSFKGVEAQLGLAQSCLKQKKYAQAMEQYELILKDHPKNLSALNNLGICYLETQKLDQAKEMFERVKDQNPNDMVALSNLSDIEFKLAQQNKDGKQEDHLKETIRLCDIVTKSPDPFERAVSFNRLGACYQIQKKFQEAEDAFIKSIAAEPKFVLAWANKAQVELMLDKPGESLASLKKSEELLKDDFSKRNLSDANINFIQQGLKKIVSLQENFGKAADEIKAKMDAMLKRPNVLAGHKNITKEYEELEKQRIEMLKKQYDKIQTNQGKSEGDDKDYELLQQQMEMLKKKIDNQSKEIDEIEKKQKEQAKRTAALEQRVDKLRDTLRASGVYEQGKIKAWMNENRSKEEGKYAKAFYWTLLNYLDSYRAASTGILQTNVEHAEIDSKVSTGVTLAKKALEVGTSLCESLPLVGSIFKVIDGAIDYCYSEYKQKKFEDKVNSINKIIMENHTANTQEDLSQVLTKAAIEIAKKKSTAKVFIQLQFELDNPKPLGTIDKITGFFSAKISQIREYALGKQIELYDSVGGGEALKDVILCLAHLQKNFADVIKKSETILLDVQIEQIVTEKIQTLLNDVKEVPQTLEPIMEDDWEVPQQTPEQIKFLQEEKARKEQLKKEAEQKKQQEIDEQQKKLQQQQAEQQQPPQQPPPQQPAQQPPTQQPPPQQPPTQQPPTQQPPPQQPPTQQPPPQQPPTQQPSQQPPQQSSQQQQIQQPPPQQSQKQNNQIQQEEENVQVQQQAKPIEVGNQDKQEKKQTEEARGSSCCVIY